MYLTFRAAQVSDFDGGFSFVRQRHGYDESLRKEMKKLWRELWENGHGPIVVQEDRDQPKGQKLVGFGVAFFACDWFVEEAKTILPPFLGLRVLEKWRCGKRPYLLRKEIIDAQLKDGLNAVSLNWGWDTQRYGPEDTIKIRETQSQSYLSVIVGYRLKEFVQEALGAEERDRLVNLGVDTRRDYREFLGTKVLPPTMGPKHPYLMTADMTELRQSEKKVGMAAYNVAHLGPPRFGFLMNEQEVLRRALLGKTDENIADGLNLSLITVKKRWQSIYAKVAALDSELLGDSEEMAENSGFKQRRRFLLKTLASHPEELWPNQPLKKAKS